MGRHATHTPHMHFLIHSIHYRHVEAAGRTWSRHRWRASCRRSPNRAWHDAQNTRAATSRRLVVFGALSHACPHHRRRRVSEKAASPQHREATHRHPPPGGR